jgi:hypothetical protein
MELGWWEGERCSRCLTVHAPASSRACAMAGMSVPTPQRRGERFSSSEKTSWNLWQGTDTNAAPSAPIALSSFPCCDLQCPQQQPAPDARGVCVWLGLPVA